MPYPTSAQLISLYESHEEIIQYLTQQPVISAADLYGQHRNVLSRLASEYWSMISLEGRDALLSHDHHFVRSPAAIGKRQLENVLDKDIQNLSCDELRMRLQDLNRRAAEMEVDQDIQSTIRVSGSRANTQLAALNVELNKVRNRLNALGHPEAPKNYVWI